MRNNSSKQYFASRQLGLNLIELMISIVIGLFISLMVVQYLSTSSKLFKQQGVDTTLEANGTFAISYLSQFVRQAGTNNPMGTDVPFYVGECGDADPCTYNSDNVGESDQIAIQMFPQNNQDCVGNDVPDGSRIANVFYVDTAAAGGQISSLYCQGYDIAAGEWLGDAVALIDGIDRLQVLYGVSDPATGQVNRYVDASRVAPAGATPNEIQDAWDGVRSTKVALLVSDGADTTSEIAGDVPFQLLDSPQETFSDRISRKVYSTTITINNKLP